MPTAVSTYGFINAKLRGRISKLLSEEFFLQMARSRSLIEAMVLLKGTSYTEAVETYNRTGDIRLCELDLTRIEWQGLRTLDRFVPEAIKPFAQAILERYEVSTLKNALRLSFERIVRGRPVDDKVAYFLRGDGITDLPLDLIINAADLDDLEQVMMTTRYGEILADSLHGVGPSESLFGVEVALDRWYFEHLLEAASTLSRADEKVARRLIGIQIDIQNLNWLVRMGQFHRAEGVGLASSVVPGGALFGLDDLEKAFRTDRPLEPLMAALGSRYAGLIPQAGPTQERDHLRRLGLLEEILRTVLFHEIRRTLGGFPFTVGTMLAYLLLLQNEVRVLTSILNAKYYDLPASRVEGLI